jgi:hypothetical protein
MQPFGKEHSTVVAGHEMLLLVQPTPSTHCSGFENKKPRRGPTHTRSLVHESPSGQVRAVMLGWQLGCAPGPGIQTDGKHVVLLDGHVTLVCTHPVAGSHESIVQASLVGENIVNHQISTQEILTVVVIARLLWRRGGANAQRTHNIIASVGRAGGSGA